MAAAPAGAGKVTVVTTPAARPSWMLPLIAVLLLGVIGAAGLFGYSYLQSEREKQAVEAVIRGAVANFDPLNVSGVSAYVTPDCLQKLDASSKDVQAAVIARAGPLGASMLGSLAIETQLKSIDSLTITGDTAAAQIAVTFQANAPGGFTWNQGASGPVHLTRTGGAWKISEVPALKVAGIGS